MRALWKVCVLRRICRSLDGWAGVGDGMHIYIFLYHLGVMNGGGRVEGNMWKHVE